MDHGWVIRQNSHDKGPHGILVVLWQPKDILFERRFRSLRKMIESVVRARVQGAEPQIMLLEDRREKLAIGNATQILAGKRNLKPALLQSDHCIDELALGSAPRQGRVEHQNAIAHEIHPG